MGLLACAALLQACSPPIVRPVLLVPDEPPVKAKPNEFLKLHMRNGELYLLESWRLSEDRARIEGAGSRYDALRRPLRADGSARGVPRLSVPVAEVALVELDRPEDGFSHGVLGLAFMTTVMGALSIACAIDPKECFGSCPTFYLDGADAGRPLAEGFSSSIARALEERDVDALFGVRSRPGGRLRLVMRNEALETHAVRRVRLLTARRPRAGRVLAGTDGRFYEAFDLRPARSCRAPEGDCAPAVAALDELERSSTSDGADLATREQIELTFAPARGPAGLVLGGRQTLLTTFLFYQTMAHFGRSAGAFLASLERSGERAREAMGMARELGGIEVAIAEGAAEYRSVGGFDEKGPIAGDVQLVPFDLEGSGPLRVRLRLTKGHWRLGYVALARLGAPVEPLALDPVRVERNGHEDPRAKELWRRGDGHVVTLPGDVSRIEFLLPQAGELELFLESEGYYYEWMRREWLAEENTELAWLSLTDPKQALRRMAAPFKQREPTIEQAFWASRFRR